MNKAEILKLRNEVSTFYKNNFRKIRDEDDDATFKCNYCILKFLSDDYGASNIDEEGYVKDTLYSCDGCSEKIVCSKKFPITLLKKFCKEHIDSESGFVRVECDMREKEFIWLIDNLKDLLKNTLESMEIE